MDNVCSIDVGREIASKISKLDYLALAVMCDELTSHDKDKADWVANNIDRLIFDKAITEETV